MFTNWTFFSKVGMIPLTISSDIAVMRLILLFVLFWKMIIFYGESFFPGRKVFFKYFLFIYSLLETQILVLSCILSSCSLYFTAIIKENRVFICFWDLKCYWFNLLFLYHMYPPTPVWPVTSSPPELSTFDLCVLQSVPFTSHRDEHQISLQQPRPVSQADLDNILVPRPPADPSKATRRSSATRARGTSAVSSDGSFREGIDPTSRLGYGDGMT